MNITIFTSKISKKFIIDANKEYLKRLSRYCKIKVVTTNNYNKELSKIDSKTYTINVNNTNNTISSETVAEHLNTLAVNSNSKIFIFINADCDYSYNDILTVSKMDIDNELLCTLVLEQIYRGFRINNKEPYHK